MSFIHGHAHKCVCGRLWYDSDGQPCHRECEGCGRIIDEGLLCDDCIEDNKLKEEEGNHENN